jgi:hypothetical protein
MELKSIFRIFRKNISSPYISPLWGFYSGVIMGIITNNLYDIIQKNTYYYILFLIIVLAPIVILVILSRRATSFKFGEEFVYPSPKKGLILLVSREDSAMQSILYQKGKGKLERVWLLPSNEMEKKRFGKSSIETASNIIKACENIGIKAEIAKSVSPADSQDTFDTVSRIYRNASKYGMDKMDIGSDFTGGTKPMTLGMIMACLPQERELQYVSFNADTKRMYGPYFIDYRHELFDLLE